MKQRCFSRFLYNTTKKKLRGCEAFLNCWIFKRPTCGGSRLQKQSQSPLSNLKGSNPLSDSSLLGFFISVFTRRGYNRAFPASSALGVFQTPNRLSRDYKKKTPPVRDVPESPNVGGRREFFRRKNRLLGATAPSLPSRLQPCASMQKLSQSPISNLKGSNPLSDSSLLGASVHWFCHWR